MNEDIDIYFDKSDSTSFIESLGKTRQYLKDSVLLKKLDLVLEAELDLALLGAEKAKSEILKLDKENKVRPIK